ncbi:hypothetical protein ACI2OX_15865 [Bacillus sp. N9]
MYHVFIKDDVHANHHKNIDAKNSPDRYNVFIDEKFAFGVDEDVLIRFQLRKGKELTELEISQIQYEDEIRKALNAAIHFYHFGCALKLK